MVNLGLVRRSLRELLPVSLGFGLFTGTVVGLLSYALPQVQARFMQRGFIPPPLRELRKALLGVDTADASVAEVAFSMVWVHPILLILLAHAILVCTRVPSGEVERGTIDVLLALPVSRWKLFRSETAAWFVTAGLVLGLAFLGCFIGTRFVAKDQLPSFARIALSLVNLALVYGAVGCAALAIGAGVDRRMRAVMGVLVVTVGTLMVNFLEPLWEPAKHAAPLSLLHYYKPFEILRSGSWPLKDMAVLGSLCALLWVCAGVVFSRRDITTT
ncbi:MAG: ABC transporter permease [Phycisphaerales bacterium]